MFVDFGREILRMHPKFDVSVVSCAAYFSRDIAVNVWTTHGGKLRRQVRLKLGINGKGILAYSSVGR